ncbi:MAG: hypothetical protein U0694_08835 [Anaerolineae bacterium]
MMLSWKLWNALHQPLTFWRPTRLLLPEVSPFGARAPTFVTPVLLPWMCLCTVFPYLLIPLTATFICARIAIRTSTSLARLHELGRYELLCITPLGFWRMVLRIGSLYMDVETKLAAGLFAIGIFIGSVVVIVMNTASGSSTTFFITVSMELVLVIGVYLDFRQAASASFLIGIAASSFKERTAVSLTALAGCVTMQLAAYGLWFVVFFLCTNNIFLLSVTRWVRDGAFTIGLTAATTAMLITRELAIYVLWRWLSNRIDDDLPVLSVVRG